MRGPAGHKRVSDFASRYGQWALVAGASEGLGEGLWHELGKEGIDAVVSCPGAIRTPGYLRTFRRIAPGILPPETVARTTLDALGKGPTVAPGMLNRIGRQLITRFLPRKPIIRLIGKSMKKFI